MLTEKDYCDYETSVAFKELGFSEPTLAYYHGFLPSKPLLYLVIDEDCMPKDGANVFDLLSNSNKYKDSKNIDAPTLWEAQKWLREEKKLHITIYSQSQESWQYRITKPHQKLEDGLHGEDFSSYEEALSEGIKNTINFLKENNGLV